MPFLFENRMVHNPIPVMAQNAKKPLTASIRNVNRLFGFPSVPIIALSMDKRAPIALTKDILRRTILFGLCERCARITPMIELMIRQKVNSAMISITAIEYCAFLFSTILKVITPAITMDNKVIPAPQALMTRLLLPALMREALITPRAA